MGSDQDSGASSRVSLAKYDPASSSWKMSQTLLFEDSDASLGTFARSGTMRSGKLYQRKTPVRRISESDSSSSQRFATPARKGNQLAPSMLAKHPGCAAILWPTPRTQITRPVLIRTGGHRCNLEEVMGERHPDTVGGTLNPAWVEWLMGFPEGWLD